VVDVFAFPQSGTTVSVETIDEKFQMDMLEALKQVGRPENMVGWYHSHPGFGCWLSDVDVNTAKTIEKLNARSVAVVVDPIQSVKGKVVLDAFRTIPTEVLFTGSEPRITTSNLGHLRKPGKKELIMGLNRSYYSLNIGYRKTPNEIGMLNNLHKQS